MNSQYRTHIMQKRMLQNELRDWNDLRFFLAVYETGSFTKASVRLRTDQSTVGRRIASMEQQLGAKLFDRHGRGMRPTPAARGIAECAEPIQAAVNAIERRFGGIDRELHGIVKISVTEGLSAMWLTPRLAAFQLRNPSILIEVQTEDVQADLSRREADIAIRLTTPREPQLVAKKVGRIRFGLFASRGYLSIFGMPKVVNDLFAHRIVDHSALTAPNLQPWREIIARHEHVMYRTSSSYGYLCAVQAGYGIGLFPHYTPKNFKDLVLVPIDLKLELPIWLISHEETNKMARTRAVLDYVRDLFVKDRLEWFS